MAVDAYEEKIEHLREEAMSGDPERISKALDTAIDLLEELSEERDSVWQLLEELKASDISNHKAAQYETIESALARAKILMMTKVGEA